MELRLTAVVVAFALIGAVCAVPTQHQLRHNTNQLINSNSASEKELLNLLKEIDQRVKHEVNHEVPAKFTELVASLRDLPHSVVNSIDRQVRTSGSFSSQKLEDIWNDALIMDASEGSLRFIAQQIIDDRVSPARKNYLLTMMAFIKKPSVGAVRAVLPLLEHSQVSRQALLGVTALISNARKYSHLPAKDVQDAVNALTKYLKQHESSEDKVIVALKALQNLQSIEEALPTVTKLAADSNVKNSVRVAAMDTLRTGDKFVQDKVMAVYTNNRETSEVRIAAYKSLVSHPDQKVIRKIINGLRDEDNKQVGAFVVSHLSNLKESASPRFEEIRRILEKEEIPTSRFPSDIRKYSRNVELSHHIKTLNLGAALDADIIYDRSIAPRSVRFNMTLPMNDREINLIEVGLRQVGLEEQVEKLLSSNGPLAGKNAQQVLSEIVDFFSSESTLNEVSRSRVKYQRSTRRPTGERQEAESSIEASIFVNLDGKTVAYLDMADLTNPENDMQIVVKSLKNQLKSGEWYKQDRAFAYMFAKEYDIPTKTGYMPFTINGSVVLGLKSDSTGFWPSMSLELSTGTPEKRVVQKIHSSPSLRFNVENKNGRPVRVTVSLPKDNMKIFTAESRAYEIDASGLEKAVDVSTRQYETCSHQLTKALGIEACAKFSAPKKMLRQSEAYFAPWSMDFSIKQTDNRMKGWQLALELPQSGDRNPLFRVAFDTPNSSLKRNMAAEIQLLDEPRGLKATIEFQDKHMEGSVAYKAHNDEVFGKVELALEKNQKYSVEAGIKQSRSGRKTEWTPRLIIEQPRSESMTLTGKLAFENRDNGNKLSFHVHNNVENGKKFVKGSITKEGELSGEMKLSTELQAELGQLKFRMYGMGDRKNDGSANSDIKIDYQMPNSRKHNVKLMTKIQNLSSGRLTKMNSIVELRMTQFPEKNIHVSWNVQHKPEEQMENELNIMWGDDMTDARRKIHILQDSKFTGIRSGRTATSDNIVSILIAPLNVHYEIKTAGHLERADAPSYKVTFEVTDKVTKKDISAAWEYRHTSISPLKMSIDALLRYPGRQIRYSDKCEEIAPRTYKGKYHFQWANDGTMNVDYLYKRRNQDGSEVFEAEHDVKFPSSSYKHQGMIRMSPRDFELNSKLNKNGKENVWEVATQMTKDAKSALRFNIVGVEGKMEVSPFGRQKSSILEITGKSFSHYSNIKLDGHNLDVTSKTMKDKKPLFAIVSKMNEEIIAGPHDLEIRFQGLKSKSGEQKIQFHHQIAHDEAKGTVTYFIKNKQVAHFETYASAKSTGRSTRVAAGVTLKSEVKYQNYDGFHFGFEHQQEQSANNHVRSQSTVKASLNESQKARITIEAAKEGSIKNGGKVTGKIITEFPVYDYKHQEAEFEAEWNNQKVRFNMKGVNNEKKTVRMNAQLEKQQDRLSASMQAQSDIHNRKTEANLTADKKSVALRVLSNDNEVVKAEGKFNYNHPQDFTASAEGKYMNSPLYHASTEARRTGNQVRYSVAAKKDQQVYGSGQLTIDMSKGVDASLRMEFQPRKYQLAVDTKMARNAFQGPHEIEVRVESSQMSPRSVRVSHQISNGQLRQTMVYTVKSTEKLNINNEITYLYTREANRANKHDLRMDVIVKTGKQTYTFNHNGLCKTSREQVEFSTNAKIQGKSAWDVEGTLSKVSKSMVNLKIQDVEAKVSVSPFEQTKTAHVDLRSKRYNHQTDMEVEPRSWTMKLTSKTMADNQVVLNLDALRARDQPARLAVESKWLDSRMEADMKLTAPRRLNASFNYNGKTEDKTNLKASFAATENEFNAHAEGQCKRGKKYTTTLTGKRSDSHAELDLHLESNGKEQYAGSARYETKDGLRGQISLKKDSQELANIRGFFNKKPWNGPNELEVIYKSNESVKLNHEVNNGRWTASLTHSKAGSRKDYAEVAGQLKMARGSADVSFELKTELSKKRANIKAVEIKFQHKHEVDKKRFFVKSQAKATINKSPFLAYIHAESDVDSRMTLELNAESPIRSFEKQSAKFDAQWSKDSVKVSSKAQSSAGYMVSFDASTNGQKKDRTVFAKAVVETPFKNYQRQSADLNAQWSESSARVTIDAVDAKDRKAKVYGESEILKNRFYAKGQFDSEFSQIKSSYIELRAEPETAFFTVKNNGQELIRAEGKGKWTHMQQFNGEWKGKTRSSPEILVTVSANKIGERVTYEAVARRDNEVVAQAKAQQEQSAGLKHQIEFSLPTMKTSGQVKTDLSSRAVNGPHEFEITFECPKYGKRNVQITHKVQADRVKCSVRYNKNDKTKLTIEHSGLYKVESGNKYVMDATLEAKVDKKSYKVAHKGFVQLTKSSVQFESQAALNNNDAWTTKGKLSRSERSELMVRAYDNQGELQLMPFGAEKSMKVDIKSPVYTHLTDAHINVRSWEVRAASKTTKNSQTIAEFNMDRRATGTAELSLESVWADYRVNYDVSKSPMTALMTLKTKSYKPAIDMKVQAEGDRNAIKLNAEMQAPSSYAGSFVMKRAENDVEFEIHTKRHNKELYSGRATASIKSEGIKASARLARKSNDLVQVVVALNNRVLAGPHEIVVQLPGKQEESIKIRHEILAGLLKSSAVHMVGGNKKTSAEITGKASGKWDNADVMITINVDSKGKKYMNINSLTATLNHKHSINNQGFDASTQLKGFINRKDNLLAKVVSSFDMKRKAVLNVQVETPFNEFKKQELDIESNWTPESLAVQGKMTNAAGKSIKVDGTASLKSTRLVVKGKLDSEMKSVPSMKVDANAHAKGFFLAFDMNEKRSFELEGKVNSSQWDRVDASIRGKLNRGPQYSASLKGTFEKPDASYEFVTREGEHELMAARANAKINNKDDWKTGLALFTMGEEYANFDLRKEESKSGNRSYVASYSAHDMEPREHRVHEADIRPIFSSIRRATRGF